MDDEAGPIGVFEEIVVRGGGDVGAGDIELVGAGRREVFVEALRPGIGETAIEAMVEDGHAGGGRREGRAGGACGGIAGEEHHVVEAEDEGFRLLGGLGDFGGGEGLEELAGGGGRAEFAGGGGGGGGLVTKK